MEGLVVGDIFIEACDIVLADDVHKFSRLATKPWLLVVGILVSWICAFKWSLKGWHTENLVNGSLLGIADVRAGWRQLHHVAGY